MKLNWIILAIAVLSCFSCGIFDEWMDIGQETGYSGNKYIDGVQVDSQGRLLITQYGITWHFDQIYQWGQFANGDYWVLGPVSIIGIYPRSVNSSTRTKNGSMLNPSPTLGTSQGYDSACAYMTYSSGLNVALNISSLHPLNIPNGSSIVSSVSIIEENTPQLKSAAILTVLGNPAPLGSFRPPYCGTDKNLYYNVSQLSSRYGLLRQLPPVANTPTLATVERFFQRPWIDHSPGFASGAIHPEDNMPAYGRDMASEIGIASLMLHLNFNDSEKETLLIRFVQLGIDLYGIVQNGGNRNWGGDGGHASGRKWPILFAGIMLGDAQMQSIGDRSGEYLYQNGYGPGNRPADYISFGEDEQVFRVSVNDVTRTTSASWNPDRRGGTPVAYNTDDIGLAEWGINHGSDPYRDNKAWYAYYRQCCTAISWSGFLLAARFMEEGSRAMTMWNYTVLFYYQDRYMTVTSSTGSNPGWRSWDRFTENMWDTYRSSY